MWLAVGYVVGSLLFLQPTELDIARSKMIILQHINQQEIKNNCLRVKTLSFFSLLAEAPARRTETGARPRDTCESNTSGWYFSKITFYLCRWQTGRKGPEMAVHSIKSFIAAGNSDGATPKG